jgi:heme-degrading monooxygenase HmoA
VFLEHAILEVVPGQEPAFEAAFAEAKEIIGAMPGFLGLTISRCIERPSRYLLLVEWGRLEDHTEGFRGSPEYGRWRVPLHRFYDHDNPGESLSPYVDLARPGRDAMQRHRPRLLEPASSKRERVPPKRRARPVR